MENAKRGRVESNENENRVSRKQSEGELCNTHTNRENATHTHTRRGTSTHKGTLSQVGEMANVKRFARTLKICMQSRMGQ